MTNKNNGRPRKVADRVQSPHAIYAPTPRPGKHSLYRDWAKKDGRTRPVRAAKKKKDDLLAGFRRPVPAMAEGIAERCAFKQVQAEGYEAFVLSGKGSPAINTIRDYLRTTASIRADMQHLYIMERDCAPRDQMPSLQKYLEQREREGQATSAANESPASQPEARPGKEAAFDWESLGEEHEHSNL